MSEKKHRKVRVTVDSAVGNCPLSAVPGKEFIVADTTPAGMCLISFGAIFSAIQVLKFGGSFPWEKDPDVAYMACPDHVNRVVYKIERME